MNPHEAMIVLGKAYYIPSNSIPLHPIRWYGQPVQPHLIFKTEEMCLEWCRKYNKEHFSSSVY